jgi:hypothetical protein
MEELSHIFGPLIFFGFLAAVIIVPRYFKSRERQQMQETIRAAIERGQPLPPEVLDAMTRDVRPAPSAGRDLRIGVVWLAIAAGLAGFGAAIGQLTDDDVLWPFVGMAAVPGAIGLAFVVLALFNKGKKA